MTQLTPPASVSLPPDALQAFEAESLYAPAAWFVHRLVSLSEDELRATMDTNRIGWLVGQQVVLPGHPAHLPAAVAIQCTGTLGQLYAVYGMGLRRHDGWTGFGTHIHRARFRRMGEIGPPLDLRLRCTRKRTLMGTRFCDFEFLFEQQGEAVYESHQTAAWRRAPPAEATSTG